MPAPYEIPAQSSTPNAALAQSELSIHPSYKPLFQPRRIRISVLFYPAAGITNEEFRKYWLEEHGRIFMSLDIVKVNLTKYEQYHFDLDQNKRLAAALGMVPSPFWGLCIFEAESYDKIIEVLSHPEYQRRVFPDERVILDRSKSQVLAGRFATVFEPERARL